jgi:hypothetical protein
MANSIKWRFTIIESGVFVHKYADGSITQLVLNKNNSFELDFSYRQGCNGQWKYIAKDTIFIKCNSVDWTEMLTRGYMSERERKIKVLNENKLKFTDISYIKPKYIILERVDTLRTK